MSARTAVAVVVALPWYAWAVFRGLALDARDPLTPAIALTPYVAATAVVPILFALALRRWIVAATALAAALVLAAAVVPRALDDDLPAGADPRNVLTVMTLNVAGGGADDATVRRLVRRHDVDVAVLTELGGADAEAIARSALRDSVTSEDPDAGGVVVLAGRGLRLRGHPDAGPFAAATVSRDGRPLLTLYGVHPPHPTDAAKERAWKSILRAVPSAGDGSLSITAGDFNGTLDHREIRRVLDRGYVDAADAAGAGLTPTWPTDGGRPPITIDHVMVDRRIGVQDYWTYEVPGSDHKAVVARLALPRRGR
jgi:endonuclease/exonuclease/phosphatase (EEP) superfamily protein YafD